MKLFFITSGHDLGAVSVIFVTHCIQVDSSIVICLTSPFVILGVSGLFYHFYSIFDGKFC